MPDEDDFSVASVALRGIVTARGITTKDLSAGSGLTRQAISRMLSGRTRAPHRASIEKLAKYLDIPGEALSRVNVPDRIPNFLRPDPEIVAQIPSTIGPELKAMIENEFPEELPLSSEAVASEAYQDILKAKLYCILKRQKLLTRTLT
jgi:transcriptional regulator with XRE-family HTH domain